MTASYTYDAENRLISTAGYSYSYDGDGNRVKKTNGSTGTIYWLDAGGAVINEANLAGTTQNEYVFFGGKRIARRDVPTGQKHYYFSDHLGSASVVTNATGTIQDESDYYPYGGEIAVTNSDLNTYKFTGKERDSESSLDNFGARFDASSLGRFMSVDPGTTELIDPQSLNRFTYSRNNPLAYIDDFGEEIKYAPGLKDADEVKAIVEAMLTDPDSVVSGQFAGYRGTDNPDLTIENSDLSYGDSVEKNPGGSETKYTIGGQTEPDIMSYKSSPDAKPEYYLGNDSVLKIDTRTSKSDLPRVIAHESDHAHQARTDRKGFQDEYKQNHKDFPRLQDHDKRSQEIRANAFAEKYKKQIQRRANEIKKQNKSRSKQPTQCHQSHQLSFDPFDGEPE